jgi:hypothetical protein
VEGAGAEEGAAAGAGAVEGAGDGAAGGGVGSSLESASDTILFEEVWAWWLLADPGGGPGKGFAPRGVGGEEKR